MVLMCAEQRRPGKLGAGDQRRRFARRSSTHAATRSAARPDLDPDRLGVHMLPCRDRSSQPESAARFAPAIRRYPAACQSAGEDWKVVGPPINRKEARKVAHGLDWW